MFFGKAGAYIHILDVEFLFSLSMAVFSFDVIWFRYSAANLSLSRL